MHYYSGDKIEENETGGACSTYGRRQRFGQGFAAEISGKEFTRKN
jgi:hypothetical protein